MNTTPPRIAEVLLTSCLPQSDLAEAVLGDLAEEWRVQATVHGPLRARFWYWQQCMRSMPHIAMAWWRHAQLPQILWRGSSVLLCFSLVALACATSHFFNITIMHLIFGMLSAASEGGEPLVRNWDGVAQLALAQCTLWALIGGFVLALMQRNGPVVGVLTLAVLWLPSSITQPLWLPAEWPMWALFALPVFLVVSTVTGGFAGTLCRWYLTNKNLRRSAA